MYVWPGTGASRRKPAGLGGDGQRGAGARRRLGISLQMLLLPPGLMRPGFTRPSLLSQGEGKGGKALRTHGCSILCQRSGIR